MSNHPPIVESPSAPAPSPSRSPSPCPPKSPEPTGHPPEPSVHHPQHQDSQDPEKTSVPIEPRPAEALRGVFARWLLTASIAASIAVVLRVYSHKPVMSQKTKRGFNTVITGLSICLSLAIASSLNGMTGDLRWWILSRRYRSRRKVELILQAERMTHLVSLAFRSRRVSIHVAAILWLLILVGTQIGVASLGLCYSNDTAEKHALMVPGNISIPDMSSVQTDKIISDKSEALGAQQYTANSYGTVSIAYTTAGMDEIPKPGIIWFTGDPLMFCDDAVCRYVFHETSTASLVDPFASPVTVATSRSLDAWAVCKSWPVRSGGAGTTRNISITTDAGRADVSIPIASGAYQTIYMTNISESCGPGCSHIYAFEVSDIAPWWYSCNVTVGQVANATLKEHQVSSNLTSMVSASIALQGYEASSLVNSTQIQYQVYPAESVFGTPANGSVDIMASLLARFTIGVVAATADNNDPINMVGLAPQIGVQLNVTHWDSIILILILLVGIHLVLATVTAILAHRVVIPDRGVVEVAKVLRAMTSQYHPEEYSTMRRALTGDSKSKALWIYRDTKISDGEYDLHMEDDRHGGVDSRQLIEMRREAQCES
ncbi:hypothetical protein B0T10DRAFT_531209 [Thelonectria olida]|uniref:Uncharacterized protein n=1 Tax=Thelonectria olida TaxID=1576542 RepID=A0A9P9AIT6_9HYPO|nr:hypothetical protein B0T10DRAFT_531209 [Thelonectria olida]